MRVTDKIVHNNMINNLQRNLERTAKMENEAATGMKVSKPSDDPAVAQQIMFYREKHGLNLQYLRNAGIAEPSLQAADTALSSMGDVLVRAKELALEMSSGTQTATDRSVAALEMKQLKDQLVTLGNSQLAGKYIFAGYKSDQAPFDTTPVNIPGDPLNGTATGTFLGTEDDINVEIDRGVYLPVNYSGAKLLRGGVPSGSTGTDILGVLNNLITGLSSNNATAVQGELANLDVSVNQVLSARGEIGSRMNRLTNTSDSLEGVNVNLKQVISEKQDVDFAQLISDLQMQQTAYEAILSSSAKLSQMSLLDFMK